MNAGPPQSVLDQFGLDGAPQRLAGGEGGSYRVGGAVLKRGDDGVETAWTQALLARVDQAGFLVARPLPTIDGEWVHDRWAASEWIEGLRPVAPDWRAVIDAGLRFGEAADAVRDDGAVLRERTHRWAVADRVAWGEDRIALSEEATEVMGAIEHLLDEPATDRRFVHGDLSGNVFRDPAGIPVILDVSPYLRPRQWAAAIVVADAVLWNHAPLQTAHAFVADAVSRDLLGRALVFRLVAEQLADDPRHGARLVPYRRVAASLRSP